MAAAVPAACPVTAQQGITRITSHKVSFTEVQRPAAIRFFIYPSYLGNDRALAHVADLVDSIGMNKIDSIVVVSQSSPEGPYKYNQELSHRRVATMRKYLETHYPGFKNLLTAEPNGESWRQLRRYVLLDTTLTRTTKERIVSIIDDNSVPIEVKKRRMAKDEAYDYLYETYYPVIRNSQVWIVYHDTRAIQGALGNRTIGYASANLNYEDGKIFPPPPNFEARKA